MVGRTSKRRWTWLLPVGVFALAAVWGARIFLFDDPPLVGEPLLDLSLVPISEENSARAALELIAEDWPSLGEITPIVDNGRHLRTPDLGRRDRLFELPDPDAARRWLVECEPHLARLRTALRRPAYGAGIEPGGMESDSMVIQWPTDEIVQRCNERGIVLGGLGEFPRLVDQAFLLLDWADLALPELTRWGIADSLVEARRSGILLLQFLLACETEPVLWAAVHSRLSEYALDQEAVDRLLAIDLNEFRFEVEDLVAEEEAMGTLKPNRTLRHAVSFARFYRGRIAEARWVDATPPQTPSALRWLQGNSEGEWMLRDRYAEGEDTVRDLFGFDLSRTMAEIEIQFTGLRLAVALRVHHDRHGALPDSWSEIDPDLLAEPPRDPFTGSEVRYVSDGPGAPRFWFTGWDRSDEEGARLPERNVHRAWILRQGIIENPFGDEDVVFPLEWLR